MHSGGPAGIVTLQDQNALLPLMELGVTPVASLGHELPNGDRVFRRMDGYDTSSVEWIGSYRGPVDPEAVAAARPDLIVASPWPQGIAEILDGIAPVIIIDMFNNPMDVALLQFADAVNKTERAEELQAEFEARAAAVAEELGDALVNTTVSVVEYRGDGVFNTFPEVQAMGMIARALEPTRPAVEIFEGDAPKMSMESIGDHAADVMFLMVFDQDRGGDSDTFGEFSNHPLVQTLPVAQAGQLLPLDGIAMVGSVWGKAMNGLDQVSAVLTRNDLNRDLVQE
ncbi:MAG: ABC transporter substrate-binding protein [Pseudomonadota bacterium]